MTTHNFSDDLPESLAERFKYWDRPKNSKSLKLALAVWDNRLEIEKLAGELAQIEQNDRTEKYEWCRLCALVIEEEVEKW